MERRGVGVGGAVHQVSHSGRADYWLCGDGGGGGGVAHQERGGCETLRCGALLRRVSHGGIPRWLGDGWQ